MNVIEITSFDAPEIRLFHGLTDAQLRSRQRPEEAVVIAEGPKVVGTALDSGLRPLAMLMRRKMIDGTGSLSTGTHGRDNSLRPCHGISSGKDTFSSGGKGFRINYHKPSLIYFHAVQDIILASATDGLDHHIHRDHMLRAFHRNRFPST